jgi:molybdopterin-guanine dinucleotide biosynthesis protein A
LNEESKKLAIIVLIGGKSKRFGKDKGVVELNGKPLIMHQIDILSDFDEDLFLVARSEEQIFSYKKEYDFPKEIEFITDDRELITQPELLTPLLGIYSGLKKLAKLGFKKSFVISGDMPVIKPEVIRYIINQCEGYDCCIPIWENKYLETLFAIYPVKETFIRARDILKKEDHYGLHRLIDDENWKINYISVENDIKPLDENLISLININGPIDLQKLTERY